MAEPLESTCALCGATLDGSGHAICPACRGMAPLEALATPADPIFVQAFDAGPAAQAVATTVPRVVEVPEPPSEDARPPGKEAAGIRLYPGQVVSVLTTMFAVTCVISILTIFMPAHLAVKANPNLTPPTARPAWYFLFLYAFLHYVPTVVGIFTPFVALVALIAMPFLDRNPERAPSRRILAVAGCIALAIAVVALTVVGYLE